MTVRAGAGEIFVPVAETPTSLLRRADQKYDPESSSLPHAAIAKLALTDSESCGVRQLRNMRTNSPGVCVQC
jgi:hypothetical protein